MDVTIKAEPEALRLDIDRTALIVVDMQNSFCKKGGMFDYMGRLNESMADHVIAVDKEVIKACRHKKIPVVYLRMTYGPEIVGPTVPESPSYLKQGGLLLMDRNPELQGRFLTVGGWDWETVDELAPRSEDIMINKGRYSGFVRTELDATLKELDIKYVIFIGLFTNICVESTLRDAFFHEYFPVLVRDGCGNTGPDFTQEATVWNVTSVFGWVTTSDDLIRALN